MSRKQIIVDTFTKHIAERLWTGNAPRVFPITPQSFSVGSILPAVLYMFRHGYRRGRGQFESTYSAGPLKPSIWQVSGRLSQETDYCDGFEGEVEKDILGDLLLCDALENKAHVEGHSAEIQRSFPAHYFSAWLDLPKSVAHLRFVPEMIVSLLANVPDQLFLQPGHGDGAFPVGHHPDSNILIKAFSKGVVFGSSPANLSGDYFDESVDLSLEELLMVRLAGICGQAPAKARGAPEVSQICNALPISERAATVFREDISILMRHYSDVVPRRALTPMLETLLGSELLIIYLEALSLILDWNQTGRVPLPNAQTPISIFVDCSCGANNRLRNMAEESFESVMTMHEQSSVALMALRILDAEASHDMVLSAEEPQGPHSSQWIGILGDVRMKRHERSEPILNSIFQKTIALVRTLQNDGDELPDQMFDKRAQDHVNSLAEIICYLMGNKLFQSKSLNYVDSCLMLSEPHGIGRKRRVQRSIAGQKKKMMDIRSMILPNTLLEALVHIHWVREKRYLTFVTFLNILRERYGLWVDHVPPGMTATEDDLKLNRDYLERRLRDLGLLVSVNDADFMKQLRPCYMPESDQ